MNWCWWYGVGGMVLWQSERLEVLKVHTIGLDKGPGRINKTLWKLMKLEDQHGR